MAKQTGPEQSAPRFTLQWRAAWMADPELSDRGKLLAAVLAEHADWDTGANAHPKQATMAAALGWTERKVRRALGDLTTAGAIEPTGHLRWGVVVYRLLPAPVRTLVTGLRTASPDTGDRTTDGQSGHFGSPVRTLVTGSPDTGDLHTSSTVLPLGRTDRGGSADAPPPDGRDAPRPDADTVAGIVAAILPATWSGHPVDANSPELGDALAQLTAEGWTVDNLRDACADIGQPKASPTALLASHLGKWAGRPTPRLVTVGPDTTPAAAATDTGRDEDHAGIPAGDLARFANHPSQAGLRAEHPDARRRLAAVVDALAEFRRAGLTVHLGDDDSGHVLSVGHNGRWRADWTTAPDGERASLSGVVFPHPPAVIGALLDQIDATDWPKATRHGSVLSVDGRPASLASLTRAADQLAALADRADQLTTTTEGERP